MLTNITARHGEVPEDLKDRARQVVERLTQRISKPISVHITFDTEPRPSAEIIFTAARDVVHVARAEADDVRTAFDKVAAKFQRQLDKHDQNPKGRNKKKAAGKAAAL